MLPAVAILLEQGLSLLGNAVLAKGKSVVEEELGVKLPSGDQPLTPDEAFRLKELEIRHEEWLLEAATKRAEVELRREAQGFADTANAREHDSRIQESPNASWFAKNTAYLLDFLVIVATLAMAGAILFQVVPAGNKELFFTSFGTLLTMCVTILNYHRGTSQSSTTHAANFAKAVGVSQ